MKDELACSWLSETQEQVLACAVAAIPIEAQVELASDLEEAGDLESAVRTLHSIIQRCDMPLEEIQENATRLFGYVDRIPAGDRSDSCTTHDAAVAFKVYSRSDKSSANADLAFERLMAALDQGASLDHVAM